MFSLRYNKLYLETISKSNNSKKKKKEELRKLWYSWNMKKINDMGKCPKYNIEGESKVKMSQFDKVFFSLSLIHTHSLEQGARVLFF